MLLVLSNEVDPDYRYFVDELVSLLPESRFYDYPAAGGRPDLAGVDGVVVSGSTAGVYERDDEPWMESEAALLRDLVAEEIPTLGICFGHQIVNHALGGSVEHRGLTSRLVRADLADDPIFAGVNPTIPSVHGDHVVERGDGLEPIAATDYYPNFATRHRDAPLWTMQYHPEFTTELLPRVDADFGFDEAGLSWEDVTAVRTLENFVRLAAQFDG
jgi:GMP synthase (glutamine-hydrolysing)